MLISFPSSAESDTTKGTRTHHFRARTRQWDCRHVAPPCAAQWRRRFAALRAPWCPISCSVRKFVVSQYAKSKEHTSYALLSQCGGSTGSRLHRASGIFCGNIRLRDKRIKFFVASDNSSSHNNTAPFGHQLCENNVVQSNICAVCPL